MKSVLSVDVAKGKSMIMLSTEYGEVFTYKTFLIIYVKLYSL